MDGFSIAVRRATSAASLSLKRVFSISPTRESRVFIVEFSSLRIVDNFHVQATMVVMAEAQTPNVRVTRWLGEIDPDT